jgi:hypothetical protein
MPANGQSLLDLTRLPEGADDMIQASIVVEGDPPVATLADDAAAAAIYNRCTEEQRAWALPQRRPQAVAAFATPVSVDDAVLAAIPRSYVLTTQDLVDPACAPAPHDPRASVRARDRARYRSRPIPLGDR